MVELPLLRQIARQHRVKRLELFGSAARGEPIPSDYDFLVEFEPMEPLEHGRAYFRLLESLEQTLGASVDLVELEAIHNPYFLESIASERLLVYAA
ncbi:MAG: nucleotidyltransferase domain-containing protein [Meiothermus sp.]|uniref:nucleotidyltransferase family protein n=1 Tax=Meiothermus sp. TaxID=1955249 RepID=UPI0025FEBD38|nr:nucleotidyltransferase domain-containing protein [Meiothermus sp.]MCS7069280.1 nucleotidyltransferase domain-containing protein [Meiothermus sp.]